MENKNKLNKNKKNRKIDIWSDEVICEYCGAVVEDGLTCQACGEYTGDKNKYIKESEAYIN